MVSIRCRVPLKGSFKGDIDMDISPKVPLLRALWSLLDGIWSVLQGSWGLLAYQPSGARAASQEVGTDAETGTAAPSSLDGWP